MIVLGIDASSDAAAVGLVAEGKLLCEHTLNNGKNHSVKLLPIVETCLAETGFSFSDIDCFACGVGPGSFTGVRIGVATCKAFAQSHKKPVVSLSSLGVLADNAKGFPGGLRGAVIHARADEVFCAVYNPDGSEWLPPSVMTVEAFAERLEGAENCMLMGNGALLFEKELCGKTDGRVFLAPSAFHVIRGGAVAMAGYERAEQGETEGYEEMEPVYLRVSQAEREYKEKTGGREA